MKKFYTAAVLRLALAAAAALACTGCVHFIRTGKVESDATVKIPLDGLAGYSFFECGPGCENLWLDPDSNRVYVTSLNGLVTLLDGASPQELRPVKALKAGGYALGIDRGPDGFIYAAVSPAADMKEWQKKGGYVARIGADLESAVRVTGYWPCINGFAFDGSGAGYLASSNFNFLMPKGVIVRFTLPPAGAADSSPDQSSPADSRLAADETVVARMGLANGLVYDRNRNAVLYTDTLETAGLLSPGDPSGDGKDGSKPLYRKAALKEAFDDLCASADGRLWMTDAVRGGLKVWNPDSGALVRYAIAGMGQLSSCRTRLEDGKEILYCTELVSPVRDRKNPYSGRGVFRIPLESFPDRP